MKNQQNNVTSNKKINILWTNCSDNCYWSNYFDDNIRKGLMKSKYNLSTICYKDFNSIEEFNKRILETVVKNKINLFISKHNSDSVYKSTLISLKGLCKTVLFCADNSTKVNLYKKVYSLYDLVWLLDDYNQKLVNKYNKRIVYLPWGANMNFPVPSKDPLAVRIPRVLFVGSIYGSRVKMINQLLKQNIPVDVYTNMNSGHSSNFDLVKNKGRFLKIIIDSIDLLSFSVGRRVLFSKLFSIFSNRKLLFSSQLRVFDSVDYLDYVKLVSTYRLVLSSPFLLNTFYSNKPVEIINSRVFEIPALYGLQLVYENYSINRYFENGTDVVIYNNENLKSVIEHYLYDVNETEIENMVEKARKKIELKHKWENRIDEIFEFLH
jgi:hypothetical protein